MTIDTEKVRALFGFQPGDVLNTECVRSTYIKLMCSITLDLSVPYQKRLLRLDLLNELRDHLLKQIANEVSELVEGEYLPNKLPGGSIDLFA